MKFLVGKYQPNIKENVIEIIKNFNENYRFFESFSYLNNAMYYNDLSGLYFETLSAYLQAPPYYACSDSTPLLITWTIQPKNVPFLHMSDPNERLRQNMLGLAAWVLDKSFRKINVTESSNFKLDVKRLQDIGKKYKKDISYLTFLGSDNVSKFGKGYGEGEIVEHTFNNDSLFKDSSKFVKMNGKQYVPFYEYIFMPGGRSYQYFNLHFIANKPAIDTRFYCIDKKYYIDTLFDAYKEVNDHIDNYLEHVFYEKTKDRVNYYIPREPIVLGRQGSVDRNYGDYPQLVHEFTDYLIKEIV